MGRWRQGPCDAPASVPSRLHNGLAGALHMIEEDHVQRTLKVHRTNDTPHLHLLSDQGCTVKVHVNGASMGVVCSTLKAIAV
jgi:hypothetical protein